MQFVKVSYIDTCNKMRSLMHRSKKVLSEMMNTSLTTESLKYMDSESLKLYQDSMSLLEETYDAFDDYMAMYESLAQEVHDTNEKLDQVLKLLEEKNS